MSNKIKCPNCNVEIDIENIIQAGAKDTLDKEISKLQKEFADKLLKTKQENELAQAKAIEIALQEQKNSFKNKETEIKNKLLAEQEEARLEMEKELEEKSAQLKEFNKLKAEYSRLAREKSEATEKAEAEAEKKLNIILTEEKQKLQKLADEKYELKIMELEKQLQDQKNLTEEMRKRQEQGSMQLQGEIQELAIEKYLKENFIFDEIREVGKGDMGADSLQIINTNYKTNCGTIYYESKRTKTFKEEWITKFKADIQAKGADIGVLVTSVYPKGMTRMGMKDGVYICTYEEFKALSFILRDTLIKISDTKLMQENRHEKSAVLYNYLTSTEFRFQFETIVNAFVTLQTDLENEKRAMQKLWKKREKEIQNVLSATTDMYGAIQGISGNAIQKVEALELPLLE